MTDDPLRNCSPIVNMETSPTAAEADYRRGSNSRKAMLLRHQGHHLSFVQPRALGRKASDEFAVPLCRIHHRAVHRTGDERAWWKTAGIDPVKIARKLWKDTRANKGQDRRNASLQATQTDLPLTSDGVDSTAP